MDDDRDRGTYDTTCPFLALLHDRDPAPGASRGGYLEKLNSVYLVNPTDVEIRATVAVSGFFSDPELGVLASEKSGGEHWTVPPQRFVCIEHLSDDELDEVVCSWSILIESGFERVRRVFSAGKRRWSCTWFDDIPVLGKPGLLISRA